MRRMMKKVSKKCGLLMALFLTVQGTLTSMTVPGGDVCLFGYLDYTG